MQFKEYITIFASVLALVSCNKNTTEPAPKPESTAITAIQLSTKTHLGDRSGNEIPILWDATDRIWVRSASQAQGSMGTAFSTTGSDLKDGGRSAIFKGSVLANGPFAAVYPYEYVSPSSNNAEIVLNVPRVQSYSKKSFGAQANITAAVWESGTVATFNNLVGTLKLTVSGRSGISKVQVTDKDENAILWGKCTIIPGKDGVETITWSNDSKEKNRVSLVNTGNNLSAEGTIDYYLSIPEGAFAQGFVCELCDSASRVMKTVTVDEDCTVHRGMVINLNKKDPELIDFSGGKGTVEDPYKIATSDDIVALAEKCAENPDKYASARYVQTSDIVMTGIKCRCVCTSVSKPFNGTYDGGGHSITGYSPTLISGEAYGLFANAENAEIKNLKVVDFKNNGSCANSAAVVGKAKNCTISGISVEGPLHFYNVSSGSVAGTLEGGSVVGCNYKGFIQNEKTGTFRGESGCTVIGGIVGSASDKAVIKDCSVLGNVTGKGMHVGGIAGVISGATIENCKVLGGSTVVGDSYNTAGIVARMSEGAEVCGCSVDASIACWYHELGGITSWIIDGTISDCVVGSNAQIRCGMGKVGGIAGRIGSDSGSKVEIDNCVVYGDVTGTWAVGGIAGFIDPRSSGFVLNITNTAFVGGDIWTCGFYNTSDGNYAYAGGVAGWLRLDAGSAKEVNIVNCFTDPACIRIDWDKAERLGVGGIIGGQTGSTPVKVSGCYSTLTADRMRLNGGNTLSSKRNWGSIAGVATSATALSSVSYPVGTPNASSMTKDDVMEVSIAQLCDGTVLRRLNGFVGSYSGGIQLKKWGASSKGYPVFQGMAVNPTEGYNQPLRVSLIGDSLTSFDGYVPHGYKATSEGDAEHGYRSHYPTSDGAVTSASQTYWYMLIYNYLHNAILDINLAYSGTAVTRCTNTSYSSQYWYNDDFNKRYIENGGVGHPDIILINGGANDWARGTVYPLLGSINCKSTTPPGASLTDPVFAKADACKTLEEAEALPDATFFEAYVKLVKMMTIQYPGVKIIVLIHDTLYEGVEKSMIAIADHYKDNCRYVDLYAVNGFNDLGFNGEYLQKGYQPNMPKHDFDWSITTLTGHGDHYSAQASEFIAKKIYTEIGSWLESGKWGDSSDNGLGNFDNNNGEW